MSKDHQFESSAAVPIYRKLYRCKIDADLHMWEGLEHDFHCNLDLTGSLKLNKRLLLFFTNISMDPRSVRNDHRVRLASMSKRQWRLVLNRQCK